MPITVKHGGQGGTAAGQIIAQTGQQDLDRQQRDVHLATKLENQRVMQQAEIQSRADVQKQAADEAAARTALQFGLEGQVREQEFDRSLAKMQEDARLQASQFEYQYTVKQKQQFARLNAARQEISNSSHFTPEEKQTALRQIDLQQANIEPSMIPRDPSKPLYPEGRGIGEMWSNDDGTMIARKPDGSLQLMRRPDQSIEYMREKEQAALKGKQMELQAKQQAALMELRIKLATEDVIAGEGDNQIVRQRTPEEVERIMQTVTGDEQSSAERQSQRGDWWNNNGARNLRITDADKSLPPRVGYAQALIRTVNEVHGGPQGLPAYQRPAYQAAVEAIRQYAAMEQ